MSDQKLFSRSEVIVDAENPVSIGPAATVEPPQVELVRDGDDVQFIIVRCPCGHTTKIRCEY